MAVKWFEKAAASHSPEAQFELGLAHQQGVGVKQDLEMAVSLFQQAAANSYPPAMTRFAAMHEQGHGIQDCDGPEPHTAATELRNFTCRVNAEGRESCHR